MSTIAGESERALDRLQGRLAPELSRSVHQLEVVVLLEAEGVTDEVAVTTYGAGDVFELAEWLRSRSSRRNSPERSPARVDWYGSAWIAVLRGLVFTMGGLMTMAVAGVIGDTATTATVLLATVVGIAVMQSVAFLAYMAIERGGRTAKASALRPFLRGLVVPVVAGLLTGLLVSPVTGLAVVVALTYLMCMVLLLVLSRALLVGAVVLPTAVVALVGTLGGEPPLIADGVVVAVWVVATVVLLVSLVVVTRPREHRVTVHFDEVDVRAALPFGMAGLAVGGVVLANMAVVVWPLLDGADARTWLAVALPFLVPVSLAELLAVEVRRRLLSTTTRTADVEQFRSVAGVLLWGAWLAFLAGTILVLGVSLVIPLDISVPDRTLAGLSFALTAVLLTASLLLVSADALRVVVVVLGGSTLALCIVHWAAPTDAEPQVGLVVLAVAAVVGIAASVRCNRTVGSFR